MDIISARILYPLKYSESDNEKIISEFLRVCQVNSTDDLTDEDCCLLYDILYPRTDPAVGTYYKAMRKEIDCTQFMKDVRMCLKSNQHRIVVHTMCLGSVVDETKSLESQLRPYEYEVK